MSIFKKKELKSQETSTEAKDSVVPEMNEELHQEIAVVITLAIYMYDMKMREDENAIITIQKMMKPYSPWSSKIYSLREQPLRIPGLRTRLK
jgi:hypothetical protein